WRGKNDVVRQMMLGLGQAGYTVHEYNTDEHPESLDTDGRPYDRGTFGPVWLNWEKMEAPIAGFRPDLIICNAGGLSFRADVVRELRRRIKLLGIALSDPEVYEPATRHIAANFHRFLTNVDVCVPRYRALGVDSGVLPAATNDEFFHPM